MASMNRKQAEAFLEDLEAADGDEDRLSAQRWLSWQLSRTPGMGLREFTAKVREQLQAEGE